MKRWYVTLKVQMAVDSDMPKDSLEETLSDVNMVSVEFMTNKIDPYTPDQVEVEYLEADDA